MGTLYDLLPDAPRPSTTTTSTTATTSHVVDGVIGTFHDQPQYTQDSPTNPKSIASNLQNYPTPTPSTNKTSEVICIQSTDAGKNKSKKGKGKNKEDKNNPQYEKGKMKPTDDKDKRKSRYPFLIYGDDKYRKYCPRQFKVTKFLQGTAKPLTPIILYQPFPSQQQAQLVIHDQPSPSTTYDVLMCTGDLKKNDITLTTRAKDYSSSKEKVDDIPPPLVQQYPSTSPPNDPLHIKQLSLDTILCPPPKGVV
jgi:hypothetical protein